MNGAV